MLINASSRLTDNIIICQIKWVNEEFERPSTYNKILPKVVESFIIEIDD